jgi:2-dehydro-3-deoxyphosphooctonate aldolase (KDO 8-P synthase)
MIIICGPNVIESETHTLNMAKKIKDIFQHYDVDFYFKVSFDKANRSSLQSYRGLGFDEGLRILKKVKEEVGVKILTDIHENWQAEPVSKIVDIIQIPAFLCRQTDLLKAAAETGKIIHVKKGQMCSAEQMHKCKEKIIAFGNSNVILCERGNSFGYQDLVVDPRNLIWLKSNTNKVTMDITHCLQQPSQKMENGIVRSGGFRELIPYMGKIATSLEVDGLFLEVHDNPEKALCDGPTQWPLERLEWLLDFLNINKRTFSNEFCILCKKQLINYDVVYDKNIRGDKHNCCQIVKCNNCKHIQLIGFRNNLKQHYDEDNQSNDIVNTFNITKNDIIAKEKIEIYRRLKYLDINSTIYNILDVGAGYCSFAKILSKEYTNVKVTCLEPSIKRSEIGKQINNIHKDDPISIYNIYLDEEFVKKNKETFDIITSWHVFEHLDDLHVDSVLKNMYKCCKKNGKIILEVPNSNDELLKIDSYKKINYMIHHLSYWNENSFTKLLLNNNITNFKFQHVQRYGFKNYLNWIYRLGEKQDCDMNDDKKNISWLKAKETCKNTDALLVIITK